jgi:hypothetical protein
MGKGFKLAFYKKVLEDTVNSINKCYNQNFFDVNVRRVRKCSHIPSSERSKINFISRALEDLKNLGYLEFVGKNSPKVYKILQPIDWPEVLKNLDID